MRPPVLLLLVEDNVLIAMAMQATLEEAGFSVHNAPHGEEAIALLSEHPAVYSGLVTDIRLGPNMDGWAVARKAREVRLDLPVVYVSGDSVHEHPCRGVSKSIMLQKPFQSAELVKAVSASLHALPPGPAE